MDYFCPDSLKNKSNEDIASLCQHAPRLCNGINSTKVVKILPDVTVKFGIGVYQSEAATMNYVFRHSDKSVVRVPQVYRFFTHGELVDMPFGYLVMEFVSGTTLESYDVEPELVKRIVNVIDHLSTLPMPPSQGPGPVYGGIAQGCLWTEYGAGTPFKSVKDMENWLNQRLNLSKRQLPRFSLDATERYFSHMDIARRNVMLTDTNEIYLLGWAYAGFYPKYFQRFCIEWCLVDDDPYILSLLHHLPGSYSNGEDELLGDVLRVNSRYLPPVGNSSD